MAHRIRLELEKSRTTPRPFTPQSMQYTPPFLSLQLINPPTFGDIKAPDQETVELILLPAWDGPEHVRTSYSCCISV